MPGDKPVVNNRRDRRRLKLHLLDTLDASLRERQCGECSGCCTVFDIPVLDKAAGDTCKHVGTSGGCSIYGERPQPCQDYQCGWRVGIGALDDRPDRIGVVLTPTPPGAPGHPALLAHELYPGAFADAWGFLSEIAERSVLLLIDEGIPKQVMGPDYRIQGMGAVLEEIKRLNVENRARR